MSANPFRLNEKVEGNYVVEKVAIEIVYFDRKLDKKIFYNKEHLDWDECEVEEYLMLDEIFNQILKNEDIGDGIPLIQITYENGLWGVIFEIGNSRQADKQWFVHGITKGYA